MAYVTTDLKGIRYKLSPENLQNGRYAMAEQMLADMDPHVPKDMGDMRTQAFVAADGSAVLYYALYAKAQFYGTNGKVVFRNYTTPGTGKRWDLVGQGLYLHQWLRVFKKGMKL